MVLGSMGDAGLKTTHDGKTVESSCGMPLLPGVIVSPLVGHRDDRGIFTEIFRQHNFPELQFCQWNMVASVPNVLRGVHVHHSHADYLILASGRCIYGLYDCRKGSPTEGRSYQLEAHGESPYGLVIPPGVAHGFYFLEPSVHVYAVTSYWDPKDELGCRFDDVGLGIKWPNSNPLLSERDRNLPPLAELLRSAPIEFGL